MKRTIPVAIAMVALILDSHEALLSAREGVMLCIQTVIPALFPFLVLSGLLLEGSAELPFLRPLGRLCRVPEGAEGLLIPAFLGGYPVGAQSVGEACRGGQLGKEEAEHMMAYCNNCGPAFLFGMASSLFPEKWMPWALWGIHVGSAVMVARIFPAASGTYSPLPRREKKSLSDSLMTAVRVMGMICGWVVIFRVLIGFLKRWFLWLLPAEIQVLIMGLLELTNGCCALNLVEPVALRFLFCSVMLSLGGLCVAMQTVSVTKGLSLRYYWRGKLWQCLFSLLLSLGLFRPVFFCGPILLILMGKQKSSSVSAPVGV